MPAEKIHFLDLGLFNDDLGWFLPGALGGALTKSNMIPKREWTTSPITAAVIEHKDGNILFDTGIALDAMDTHAKGLMDAFPLSATKENEIERQLSYAGLKPGDISFVVMSHLHFDHMGQLPVFNERKIPILVQKKELQTSLYMVWQGKGGAYDMTDLAPLQGANWIPIDDDRFELVDGVELEFTGGHTAGHQVLHVSLRSGNNFTLAGDFVHVPKEYDIEVGGWLMGNPDEWHSYIRKLKVREKARKEKFVVSHDPDFWNKYPKAPKYLE